MTCQTVTFCQMSGCMLMTLISLILLKTVMICFHPSLMTLPTWNNGSTRVALVWMFSWPSVCSRGSDTKFLCSLVNQIFVLMVNQQKDVSTLKKPRRVGGWNTFLGNSVVKSQKHLLPWGDWNQFVPRGFLSQFTNHWFCLILIIVVLSGEILALVLVKDLSKYKTERHV